MKRMGFGLATGIACVLAALPAAAQDAEWGWTSWSMEPEQVVEAGDGRVAAVEEDERNRVFGLHNTVSGQETIGDVPYELKFYFDPDTQQLAAYDVLPDKGDCATMESTLQAGGEADRSERGMVEIASDLPPVLMRVKEWDRTDGGTVRMINISGDGIGTIFCKAIYMAPGIGGE